MSLVYMQSYIVSELLRENQQRRKYSPIDSFFITTNTQDFTNRQCDKLSLISSMLKKHK